MPNGQLNILIIWGDDIGTGTTTNLYIGSTYSLWTKSNNCAYLRYKDGTLLDKQCVSP